MRPLFVFIINAALTETLAAGSPLFRERHGHLLNVRMFATHDIEEETVPARTVAESLEASGARHDHGSGHRRPGNLPANP